jgi:hypothetical protein
MNILGEVLFRVIFPVVAILPENVDEPVTLTDPVN